MRLSFQKSLFILTYPFILLFSLSTHRLSQQALFNGITILLCTRWHRNDWTSCRTRASTSNPFPKYGSQPTKGPYANGARLTPHRPRWCHDTQEMLQMPFTAQMVFNSLNIRIAWSRGKFDMFKLKCLFRKEEQVLFLENQIMFNRKLIFLKPWCVILLDILWIVLNKTL